MPSLVPLDNLLGAVFIGIVLSTILFGVSCLQTYLYYTQHCKRDSTRLKAFVALVVALDSLHVAFVASAYYHYTVTNFGDYTQLQLVTWTIVASVQISIGGLVGLLVQFYFAMRLYTLGRRRILIPVVICLLAIVELGGSIAYTVIVFLDDHYFSASATQGHGVTYTALALTANILCDLLIAGSTVYYLQGGRSAFHQTNKAITLLMTYALSTCILAMVFTIVCLITWVTLNKGLVYAVFYWILVRIYPCSLLSTLNSRDTVRRALEGNSQSQELTGLEPQTAVPTGVKKAFDESQARQSQRSSSRAVSAIATPLPMYRPHDNRNIGHVVGAPPAHLTPDG